MSREHRRRRAREALRGYASGPDAPLEATATALAMAASARAVVLVEGISDQIALESVAGRQGRDLAAEGVVVVPIGGAQAATRYLVRFGPLGTGLRVAGLCDRAEERFFRHGLAVAGLGDPRDRSEMEALGFHVCVDDLEQELIRASSSTAIEELLAANGDLTSFRTLQKQPAWRDRAFDAQVHRWLRAGAGRNLRYARLLVDALPREAVPHPLVAVLAATETGG